MVQIKIKPIKEKSNAQEYLDTYYPQNERYKVKILNLQNQNLTGKLDLKDFANLEILICSINRLTELDISQNHKLIIVEAFRNKIKADLSIFSHLTKLRKLDIGVASEGFSIKPTDQRFINNQFSGSLESLKKCRELEELCIGYQTETKEGLKYLPTERLRKFGCQGTVFKEQLKPFDYDVQAWKLVNYPLEAFDREFTNEELIKALIFKKREAEQELAKIKQNQNQWVVIGKLWTNEDWKPKIERLESKIELISNKIREIEKK